MKKTYIKIFTILIMIMSLFTLISCFDEATTLEFVKLPQSVYELADKQINLRQVEVKINNETFTLQDAMKQGAVVTGYEFDETGEYTLTVKYDTASIYFTYKVGVIEITQPDPDTSWDGEGTDASPYLIASTEELLGVAYQVNNDPTNFKDKEYRLMADIDLTNVIWTPIYEGARKNENDVTVKTGTGFSGSFDGNGHTISGLNDKGYYPETTGTYETSSGHKVPNGYAYGLFGLIDGAEIKDLIFTDVNIEGSASQIKNNEVINYLSDSVGVVAGYIVSGSADSKITNCEVRSGSVVAWDAGAGIVGRSYGGVTFDNCKNAASIEIKRNTFNGEGKAGGITAITSSTNPCIISNCSNSGRIYCNYTALCGGILGVPNASGKTTLENCVNTGIVESLKLRFDTAGKKLDDTQLKTEVVRTNALFGIEGAGQLGTTMLKVINCSTVEGYAVMNACPWGNVTSNTAPQLQTSSSVASFNEE